MRQINSRKLVVFLSILLCCAGCNRSVPEVPHFTPANFDKVNVGMTKEQVEKILGPPTSVADKQMLVFGDQSKWQPVTTYRYEDGQKFAEIVFKNDQVEKKNSNIDAKP